MVGIIADVLVFALIDFSINTNRPDEFTGLEAPADALYFTLTVLLTVGFGDITAQGRSGMLRSPTSSRWPLVRVVVRAAW